MVTAEVLEEERKKKEDNAQLEASMAEAEVVEQAELEKSSFKKRTIWSDSKSFSSCAFIGR